MEQILKLSEIVPSELNWENRQGTYVPDEEYVDTDLSSVFNEEYFLEI